MDTIIIVLESRLIVETQGDGKVPENCTNILYFSIIV